MPAETFHAVKKFHPVQHAVAVGVNVVGVGRQAGEVGWFCVRNPQRRRSWESRATAGGQKPFLWWSEPLRRGTIAVRFRVHRRDNVVFFPVGHAVVVGVLPAVRGVEGVECPCIVQKVPTQTNLPAVGHAIVVCVGAQWVGCPYAVRGQTCSYRTGRSTKVSSGAPKSPMLSNNRVVKFEGRGTPSRVEFPLNKSVRTWYSR